MYIKRLNVTLVLLWTMAIWAPLYPQSGNDDHSGVATNSSGSYFQKNGQPFFFIGYYNWVPILKGESWQGGVSMSDLIDLAATYDLNYLRVNLILDGNPFKLVDGKVDLDQWNPSFWSATTGLPWHAQYAATKGVNLHISIFDGWSIKSQKPLSWPGSPWNIDNQMRDYYGDLNQDNGAGVDEMGEFYNVSDFVNNTGVGYYQKKLIDKVVSDLSNFDNIFYEVGNELLGSNDLWNYEVIKYIKSLTNKVVTNNLNPPQWPDNNPGNDEGFSVHVVEPNGRWEGGHDTSLEVKKWVESQSGNCVPVFYDPDGPDLGLGYADENRRAAWYSLTEGAAGYGGFQSDIKNGGPDTLKLRYYQHLMKFLSVTGIPFWTLSPQLPLISNNRENSLLARVGEIYFAYVRDDPTVTINLDSGTYLYKCYNPKTGTYSAEQTILKWEGGSKTFDRPSGEDWVVYIRKR